jgi:hypothetical protein
MPIRVPLVLETTDAVIHRLDISSTKTVGPYTGASGGYDQTFREPRVFDKANARQESTLYLPAVRVPCQVEVADFERLQQLFQGDVPTTALTLVLSRIDLERLGLIDTSTGRPVFNVNDKVTQFERFGKIIRTFVEPLYVWQVQPASWGFGNGYDLELLHCGDREKAMRT